MEVTIANTIINKLLYPDKRPPGNLLSQFQIPILKQFLKYFYEVVKKDKCMVNLRSGVRIFGSLFGQYDLLLKIFQKYGTPEKDPLFRN